jgi:hypothetical protein
VNCSPTGLLTGTSAALVSSLATVTTPSPASSLITDGVDSETKLGAFAVVTGAALAGAVKPTAKLQLITTSAVSAFAVLLAVPLWPAVHLGPRKPRRAASFSRLSLCRRAGPGLELAGERSLDLKAGWVFTVRSSS